VKTTKSKSKAPAVTSFGDHDVIVPVHALGSVVSVTDGEVTPDPGPVARAEAALAELAGEFSQWMQAECERLDAARRLVKQPSPSAASYHDLFRAAHDIKGEAPTFGYPLAAEAAGSLCRLIEHTPEPMRVPITLIDQHVDAVRAIIREADSQTGQTVAAALVAKLRHVADEFLVHANRERVGYLDGIVSPPLAPST
jgi:HPt (histidine-containing phosphotransfer) domain-containing protein